MQTGIGRTGRFFALEHWGLDPDLICVAKALSGGFVPIGGVLVSRQVRDRVFDGMERGVRHGSTFGGNDLAAAAGLATLRVLDSEGLVERAERLGELLLELTRPLVERYEIVRDVRGIGLMWAIELGAARAAAHRRVWNRSSATRPASPRSFCRAAVQATPVFCQVAGHGLTVVKALPPLVVEEQEIHRFAEALDDVLARAERLPRAMAGLAVELALGGMRARLR